MSSDIGGFGEFGEKFRNFSFNRFGFIVWTDRITQADDRCYSSCDCYSTIVTCSHLFSCFINLFRGPVFWIKYTDMITPMHQWKSQLSGLVNLPIHFASLILIGQFHLISHTPVHHFHCHHFHHRCSNSTYITSCKITLFSLDSCNLFPTE